jgi:hypothetical protein
VRFPRLHNLLLCIRCDELHGRPATTTATLLITKPEPPHLPGVKYFEKLAAPHVRPTAVRQASAVVI